MKILRVLILLLVCMGGQVNTLAKSPTWEVVHSMASDDSESAIDKPEVTVRDGYIYVTTSKPLTVKVMSIVGQLITEKTLPAGTSRLKITKRGIYILKAGDATVRVTI